MDNINDRSLHGDRDSELAVILRDSTLPTGENYFDIRGHDRPAVS